MVTLSKYKNVNIFRERNIDTHICVFEHICTKRQNKRDWQARKKGIKFIILSKMNNQKAHTEADKEEGDSL